MGKGPDKAAAMGMPAISAPRGTREYRQQIAAREAWIEDQLKYRGQTLDSLGIKNEEGQARGAWRTYGPEGYFTREGPGISTNFIYDWGTGRKLNIATNAEEFKNEARQNSQGQWVFDPAKADPSRWESITPDEYAQKSGQEQWMSRPENQGLTYADRLAEMGMKEMVGRGHFTRDPQSGLYYNLRNNNPNDIEWKDRFGRAVEGPANFKLPASAVPPGTTPVTAPPITTPGNLPTPASTNGGTPAPPIIPPAANTLSVPQVGSASYKPKYGSELEQAIMSADAAAPVPVTGTSAPGLDLAQVLGNTPLAPDPGTPLPPWNPPPPPTPPVIPPITPPVTPPPVVPPPAQPYTPPAAPSSSGGGGNKPKAPTLSAQEYLTYTGNPLQDSLINLFNYRSGIFGTKDPYLSGATSRAVDENGKPLEKIAGASLPGGGLWWGDADTLSKAISSLGNVFQPAGGGHGGGGSGGYHSGEVTGGPAGQADAGMQDPWAAVWKNIPTPPGSMFGNVKSTTGMYTGGQTKPYTYEKWSPLETKLAKLFY